MVKLRPAVLACVAILSASCAATAAPVTLRFDELARDTPANVASVLGISFSFTGPTPGDAFYNSSTFVVRPSDASLLSGSVLEGDSAGVLTIDFAAATDVLRFAVLLSSVETLSPGFTVNLFDTSLASLGSFNVPTTPTLATGFSEGEFVRTSGPLVRRAVIDFDDASGRFAIDNLTAQAIPAPTSLVLLGLGTLIMTGFGAVRRRAARCPSVMPSARA